MNLRETPEDKVRARMRKYRRKKRNWPKSKSLRAVSGGLPSLGKKR